jgi:hypothetical protein
MMRRIALLALIAGLFAPILASAPAHAQATRTWVSGVGDDVNPCSRTAPCKTFAGAISKTATAGEINCLDPGGFGTVTITKAMTLNCAGTLGSILASGVPGITINAQAGDKVILKDIQINGVSGGTAVAGTIGVRILNAGDVVIEDCVITQFAQQGVLDNRSGGGNLYITNSNLRNNVGAAISSTPGSIVYIVVENSRIEGNSKGVAAGQNSKIVVSRSVISGNTFAGIDGEGGSIAVNNSMITANATGVLQNSNGNIRLFANEIAFNTSIGISGPTVSFGQNRIYGNISDGTPPTAAGTQ